MAVMLLMLTSTAHHCVFYPQTNANTFVANPEKYVPAYGGFCAWGIAREGTDGNPSPAAEPNWFVL
jgi:hypothetical protein